MSKTTLGLVGVAVCGATFGIAAWVIPMARVGEKPVEMVDPVKAEQPKAEPRLEPQAIKWEYLTFTCYYPPYAGSHAAAWMLISPDGKHYTEIVSPDGKHTTADYPQLLGKKMGWPRETPTDSDVINMLGQDGWELVNHVEQVIPVVKGEGSTFNGTGTMKVETQVVDYRREYIFKRPVRK